MAPAQVTPRPGAYGPLPCGCALQLHVWDPCGPLLPIILCKEIREALDAGHPIGEPMPFLPAVPSCSRYAAKEHEVADFLVGEGT